MTVRHKAALLGAASLVLAAGCHQDMWSQPKAKAQSKSDLIFSDGSNSRGVVAGTVAFGRPKTDHVFYTGFDDKGKLVKEFPVAVDEAFLKRGQERFRVFCVPCHGELGNGKGMIAKRGFTLARPVGNYHTDRLRNMPVGHFFDVITNGYGTMYPFRSRIRPIDRWAIAAYVRVLQQSQHKAVGEIPAEEKARLEAMAPSADQNPEPELPIGGPPDRRDNAPGQIIVPNPRTGRPTADTPAGPAPSGEGAAVPGGQAQ
ncbi:MAG: cytochrome c [Armatimonadetes bacterium]|nr:cytochrome c [Armatimonadota bacterium]